MNPPAHRSAPFTARSGVLAAMARFLRDRDGNISPILALLIVPIVGAFGIVTETGNWYLTQRALQNAADAAAISASTNAGSVAASSCATSPGTFDCEAKGAAAQYTAQTGLGSVTLTGTTASTTTWSSGALIANVSYLTSGCPGSASTCYKVVLTKTLPLSLTSIVGFRGNTTLSGRPAQQIVATAIASGPGALTGYCLMALGTSGNGITNDGKGTVDLGSCDVFSNSVQKCTGNYKLTTGLSISVSAPGGGGNQSCGSTYASGSQYLMSSDPYSDGTLYALNASPPVPAYSCPTYPGKTINSTADFGSYICGNAKLGANICVTAANTVLTIVNGSLDLNGLNLQTSNSGGLGAPACDSGGVGSLTIIFTGPTTSTASLYPINSVKKTNSVLDIAAPTSGSLAGVALYQDKRTTGSKVDLNWSSNGANSNIILGIQGLIYLPNANVTVNGAIKQHPGGFACMELVANSVTMNGGSSFFPNPSSQCTQAHVKSPGVPGTGSRLALVQ